MEKGLLSFCVLCYNHGRFIEKNFQSIWNTKLKNIEIIIVDDGSTDNSVQVINELKEKCPCPCTVIAQENTGKVGHNFNVALNNARGEFVTFISADDFYESEELSNSFNMLTSSEKNAFVASSKILEVNYDGILQSKEVPPLSIDKMSNPSVKDLLELEYNEFGAFYLQGIIFQKKIVDEVNGFEEDMTGDDIVLRTKIFNYLLENQKYTFVINHNPTVCYRKHENNVSKNSFRQMVIVSEYLERYWPERRNPRIFYDWLTNTINTIDLARVFELFSKNIRLAKCLNEEEVQVIIKKLILKEKIKSHAFVWFSFRIIWKVYKILKKIKNKFFKSRSVLERIKNDEKKSIKQLLKKYKQKGNLTGTKTAIVMCDDSSIAKGGLCDRFRGIISVYQTCKRENINFKLNFVSPFHLNGFLVPNSYDWQISESEIEYKNSSLPVFIFSEVGDEQEAVVQEKTVSEYLNQNYNQIHFYTNAHYSLGRETFSEDFNSLFKPSEKLQNEINNYSKTIDSDYISISFRFIQLLGDFEEHYNIYPVLPDTDKEKYINKSIALLKRIHEQENKQIFVATDSKTFLSAAQKLPFVFTIPGEISHVDATQNDSFDSNKKTFIDFFMIANASKVYLAHHEKMFYSGFPKTAALAYNKPFETIEF